MDGINEGGFVRGFVKYLKVSLSTAPSRSRYRSGVKADLRLLVVVLSFFYLFKIIDFIISKFFHCSSTGFQFPSGR